MQSRNCSSCGILIVTIQLRISCKLSEFRSELRLGLSGTIISFVEFVECVHWYLSSRGLYYEKKVSTVKVNNSTNVNKTNNHLTSHIIEYWSARSLLSHSLQKSNLPLYITVKILSNRRNKTRWQFNSVLNYWCAVYNLPLKKVPSRSEWLDMIYFWKKCMNEVINDLLKRLLCKCFCYDVFNWTFFKEMKTKGTRLTYKMVVR